MIMNLKNLPTNMRNKNFWFVELLNSKNTNMSLRGIFFLIIILNKWIKNKTSKIRYCV